MRCKNGQTVNPSVTCMYDIDIYGYVTGCRDASHLESCSKFACFIRFA